MLAEIVYWNASKFDIILEYYAYYFESWSILQDNFFNHKTVISVRVDDLVNLGLQDNTTYTFLTI